MSTPNAEAQRAFASLGQYDSIPVVITGTRPPMSADFPGLREAMIGSAIFQLAEQLPESPLKEEIKKLALDLHVSGGEKIVRSRKSISAPSNGTKRPRKV